MASEVELLEVFRLGEAAGDAEIVRQVGDRLASEWLSTSRFRETQALTARSLQVQTSTSTLLRAGTARLRTGDLAAALRFYEQALPLQREVGDRAGEATTLNNIGGVHNSRGDGPAALRFYEQALPLRREVGDRAGEAVTRYNIAMVHRGDGRLASAVAELELVVILDEAVQHPDLQADTAMLHQVQAELRDQGPRGGPGH